jgi:hypothetical protein
MTHPATLLRPTAFASLTAMLPRNPLMYLTPTVTRQLTVAILSVSQADISLYIHVDSQLRRCAPWSPGRDRPSHSLTDRRGQDSSDHRTSSAECTSPRINGVLCPSKLEDAPQYATRREVSCLNAVAPEGDLSRQRIASRGNGNCPILSSKPFRGCDWLRRFPRRSVTRPGPDLLGLASVNICANKPV